MCGEGRGEGVPLPHHLPQLRPRQLGAGDQNLGKLYNKGMQFNKNYVYCAVQTWSHKKKDLDPAKLTVSATQD